jgi:hypothetical protein
VSEPQGSTSTGSSESPLDDEAAGSSSSVVLAGGAPTTGAGPWIVKYIYPGPEWQLTPVVDITIIGPGEPLSTMAMVDSGADSSALPISLAKDLGIDLDSECSTETGMSSGGDTENRVYRPGLQGEVFGHRFKMDATFSNTPMILLGQEDFFMHFHVSFDRPAKEFTLRLH